MPFFSWTFQHCFAVDPHLVFAEGSVSKQSNRSTALVCSQWRCNDVKKKLSLLEYLCRWTSAVTFVFWSCLVMCLKSAVIASCWYWCQFARVSLMQWGVHVSKTNIKYILLPLSLPYLSFMSVIIFFNFNFMMAWHETFKLPGNEWKSLSLVWNL